MNRFLVILLVVPALLWAQDDSFSDSSFVGDSFSDDGGFFSNNQSAPALEIHGFLKLPVSLIAEPDSIEDSTYEFAPMLATEFTYSGSAADLKVRTNIETDGQNTDISFEEAYVRLYLGSMDFEAGLIKVVWGSGDEIHVVDTINPVDYRKFVEVDYNERKMADLMLRLNKQIGSTGKLEFLFQPWFTPDVYDMTGVWQPADMTSLYTAGEAALEAYSSAYYTAVLAGPADEGMASMATVFEMQDKQDSFIRIEYTQDLSHAQGGIRYTMSTGAIDWGIMAYRGYLKEPVIEGIDLNPTAITAASDPHMNLSYTPMVMIGQEAAAVFEGFTFRQEAAVYLSENDPNIKWLFGFDRDIFSEGPNLNVQAVGEYQIIGSDVEEAHIIIGTLSHDMLHETMSLNLSGCCNIEDGDFMLTPKLTYTFKESVDVSLKYHLYEGDEGTPFGQFTDRDNLEFIVSMNY